MNENGGASTIFASALLPSYAETLVHDSGMASSCVLATPRKAFDMPLQPLVPFMRA
jgi:hypothetical protein